MAKRSPRAVGGKPRRVPVSTKIPPDLRDKLEAAAEASGRTLGNEIERRLENSFLIQEELLQFIAGKNLAALASIGICWATQESTIGLPWNSNRDTIKIAAASAASIVSATAPLQDQTFTGDASGHAAGINVRDIQLGSVGSTFASLFRSLGKSSAGKDDDLQRLAFLLDQTGVPRAQDEADND